MSSRRLRGGGGLVKRSTYYESLIRRALELDPEEDVYMRGKGIKRRTLIKHDFLYLFSRVIRIGIDIEDILISCQVRILLSRCVEFQRVYLIQ